MPRHKVSTSLVVRSQVAASGFRSATVVVLLATVAVISDTVAIAPDPTSDAVITALRTVITVLRMVITLLRTITVCQVTLTGHQDFMVLTGVTERTGIIADDSGAGKFGRRNTMLVLSCLAAGAIGLVLGYVFSWSVRTTKPGVGEIGSLIATILGGAITPSLPITNCENSMTFYLLGLAVGFFLYILMVRFNWEHFPKNACGGATRLPLFPFHHSSKCGAHGSNNGPR